MNQLSPAVSASVQGLDCRTLAVEPEFGDTAGLCEKYGFVPDQIVNTMLVAGKADPTRYAACVVLATYKLDVNKRACELLKVKRATFASAEETAAVTGMMVGGVGPFGLPDGLPIYVDSRVMDAGELLFGGGNLTSKLLIQANELKRLPVRIVPGLAVSR